MNFEIPVPINASYEEEQTYWYNIQQQIANKKEICRKIKNALYTTEVDDVEEGDVWAFGFTNEMNELHGDDDENLQLQGCNCKYCGDYLEEYASAYFSPHVICKCPDIYHSYYHYLRMEFEAAPTIVSGYSKYGKYIISYKENPPSYYKNDNPITQHIRKKKEMNAQFYDEYPYNTNLEPNPYRNTCFYRPFKPLQ